MINENAQADVSAKNAPTLSHALEKWLQDRQVMPRGITGESNTYNAENVDELARMFDQCDQAEIAAQVMKGYCLSSIRAISPDSLRQIMADRDIAIGLGNRYIDLFDLFSELPRLELLPRAAELGIARIRELKPRLGLEGIRQLVEGKEVDTLGYDQAVGMTKREIITWRKQRDKLALDQAAGPERTREADAAAASMRHEPRDLTVSRSELLANVSRSREELERGRRVAAALLPHENDDWEAERLELAHQVRKMLRAVDEEVAALDTLLAERFGAASVAPMTGEYQTLDPALVRAADDMAASQANASLLERAKHRARVMRWRGAPPKDVDAVIASAQKNDG